MSARGRGHRRAEGNQYVDAMASLYCAIGHGRREMAEVIARQAATLACTCFEPFTNPVADALAERLVALPPRRRRPRFLCQSGSEAVDTAMKARLTHVLNGHPERTLIISRMRRLPRHQLRRHQWRRVCRPTRRGLGTVSRAEVVQAPSDDVEALGHADG